LFVIDTLLQRLLLQIIKTRNGVRVARSEGLARGDWSKSNTNDDKFAEVIIFDLESCGTS